MRSAYTQTHGYPHSSPVIQCLLLPGSNSSSKQQPLHSYKISYPQCNQGIVILHQLDSSSKLSDGVAKDVANLGEMRCPQKGVHTTII